MPATALRKRPALGAVDFHAGHYQLLMAATPSSFVLTLEASRPPGA